MALGRPPKDRRSLERRITSVSTKGEWEIGLDELIMEKKIGHGSFGCVRLASWRGTEVAAKVLYDNNIDLHEFYMEMIILTRLHHPNILQVLGCSTAQVPYVLVLEHMANGSLHPYVHLRGAKKGLLTLHKKIGIVKDMTRGLAYLHNRRPQSIIHRDLKPSNILLTLSFRAKIADFGISSMKTVGEEFYKMTGETGTYRYMAPEVLRSEKYNCKVDVWSLGMLIYALFVHEPFTWCADEKNMFTELAGENPTGKFDFPIGVPSSVKRIFAKTTCANPNERWDSIYLVHYCNIEFDTNDMTEDKKYSCFGCFERA